jgi:hypothetical protein
MPKKKQKPKAKKSPTHSKKPIRTKLYRHFSKNAHNIANPLAVQWPSKINPEVARKIFFLSRLQHKLWSITLALAIIALLIVSLLDLGPVLFGWDPVSHSRERVLAQTEITALGVLFLEVAAQFKAAKNKILFLRTHWLLVLAILPLGVLFRAVRTLEIFSSLRTLQFLGKIDELRQLAPNIPIFGGIILAGDGVARKISDWLGFREFRELLSHLFKLK